MSGYVGCRRMRPREAAPVLEHVLGRGHLQHVDCGRAQDPEGDLRLPVSIQTSRFVRIGFRYEF